jgi:hypothetical protein
MTSFGDPDTSTRLPAGTKTSPLSMMLSQVGVPEGP